MQKIVKLIKNHSPPSIGMSTRVSGQMASLQLLGYFHALHLKARPGWCQWYFSMMALKSLDSSDGMTLDLPKDCTLLSVIQPLEFKIGKDFEDYLSTGDFLC